MSKIYRYTLNFELRASKIVIFRLDVKFLKKKKNDNNKTIKAVQICFRCF